MSPIHFFILLCLLGGAASVAMGRYFPECLFRPLIRGVLYIAAAIMVIVGIYVGLMAHLHGAF